MGYRSQVLMAFAGPPDAINAFFVKVRLLSENDIFFKEFVLKVGKLGEEHVVHALIGEGWKWYEGYPNVAAAMRIWDLATESVSEELPIYGKFIRIGEEDEDIDTRSFGDEYGESSDLGSMSRSIECDIAWSS